MANSVPLPERVKEARYQVAARRRENISQARMADLVSEVLRRTIHQTQWSRYESGESEPPLDVIRAMAAVSGLSEVYIAFGVNPGKPGERVPDPRAAKPNDKKKGA